MSDTASHPQSLRGNTASRIRREARNYAHDFWRFVSDRELKAGLLWWVFFVVVFFSVSVSICALQKPLLNNGLNEKVPILWLFLAGGAGMFTGMFLWHSYKWEKYERKPFSKIWDLFKSRHTLRDFVPAFFFVVITTALCLGIFALVVNKPATAEMTPKALRFIIENPGGVFALITGWGTLVGTYFAIQSILEMKHTIASFPQMVDRLTYLVNEAEGAKEGVLFFAYTILPGVWNISSEAGERLTTALKEKNIKIRATCLEKAALHEWLEHCFKDVSTTEKGPVSQKIEGYEKDCEDLLNILNGIPWKTPLNSEQNLETHKRIGCEAKSTRLTWDSMPGYYFFASSQRAILAVPIQMPRLKNPPAGLNNVVETEALGFETTDLRIIKMLRKEFIRYYGPIEDGTTDLPSSADSGKV